MKDVHEVLDDLDSVCVELCAIALCVKDRFPEVALILSATSAALASGTESLLAVAVKGFVEEELVPLKKHFNQFHGAN